MEATNRIYCYIFVGGKLVKKNDGFWEYMGRRAKVFTYIKKFHFNNSFKEY